MEVRNEVAVDHLSIVAKAISARLKPEGHNAAARMIRGVLQADLCEILASANPPSSIDRSWPPVAGQAPATPLHERSLLWVL